ncbi:MAG: hypothetical protein WBD27_03345 [Pyrinomonadaceae bacterium]
MRGKAVVMEGTYLYDGAVECDLRIVYSPVRFGSGDYEDSEEWCEDQNLDSYYVEFGSTSERGRFNAGGGCYSTLLEAVAAAERSPGIGSTIKWKE